MIGQIRKSTLGLLLPAVVFAGLWGCGGDDGDLGTDALGMLEPGIQSLDTRLQSHYDTVTGTLNSANASSAATQGIGSDAAAAAQASGLMDEDWQALRMETEDYGQDMHRILNDLGETVTTIGDCRMRMGCMMFGSPNAGKTCSSEPYMDTSTEEVEQHLDEMLDWMDQQNPSGLRQELDSHRNLMRSNIQEMGSHMRQTYGPQGGMGGMM